MSNNSFLSVFQTVFYFSAAAESTIRLSAMNRASGAFSLKKMLILHWIAYHVRLSLLQLRHRTLCRLSVTVGHAPPLE